MSPIPQTSFSVWTFFAAYYSKTALGGWVENQIQHTAVVEQFYYILEIFPSLVTISAKHHTFWKETFKEGKEWRNIGA